MDFLEAKRNPELSGTYRFRWYHPPLAGASDHSVFRLVPLEVASSKTQQLPSNLSTKKKKKKPKKSSKKKLIEEIDLSVGPHSPEYVEILKQREESRQKREQERKKGLASLAPITDAKTAEAHRKFLEKQEEIEFKLKEKEMDEDNQEKMRKYRANLIRNNANIESQIEERLHSFRNKSEIYSHTPANQQAVSKKGRSKTPSSVHFPQVCNTVDLEKGGRASANGTQMKRETCASSIKRRQVEALESDLDLMDSVLRKRQQATSNG